MAGIDAPYPLKFAFPPAQGAAGAHEQFEGLGIMGGMQEDDAHATENPVGHLAGQLIRNLPMCAVTPP